MPKSKMVFLLVIFIALPCLAQQAAQQAASAATPSDNLDSYIQVLRSDLRAQKTQIVAQAMQFTDSESAVFWPLYRNYEMDLSKLNDQKVALLKDYTEHLDDMSSAKASELANRSFALEEQRTALKRKYFAEFSKVLPANRVAKFFQVDNRVDLLVNLKIASELPLMD